MQRLLTPDQVADLLQVSVHTLHKWRAAGRGPHAIRVGKHLRYQPEEISNWLDAHANTPPGSAPCPMTTPAATTSRHDSDGGVR